MINENENKPVYKDNPHSEIMLTIVYTIVIAFFMWGLSVFLN